jgi:hypothetical protein
MGLVVGLFIGVCGLFLGVCGLYLYRNLVTKSAANATRPPLDRPAGEVANSSSAQSSSPTPNQSLSVLLNGLLTLSTSELERLVKAGDARVAAAFGKHKSVIVQGEITDSDERLMVLVGRVVPNRQAQFNGLFYYDGSGFEGLGTHANPSCLMVQNPKGRILNGRYMDGPPFSKEELFYLGEGRATNGFGAPVSCSIYGRFDELPANIRAAVKKASEDVRPLKVELDRRLEAEPEAKAADQKANPPTPSADIRSEP